MDVIKEEFSQEEKRKGFFRFFKVFIATKTIVRSYKNAHIPIWLMIILASMMGTGWMYNGYLGDYTGDVIPYPFILWHGAGFGLLVGNVFLFGAGLVLKWSGKLFGGHATYMQVVRACFIAVVIPSALLSLTWIPTLMIVGSDAFTYITPHLDMHDEIWYYLDILSLVEVFTRMWIFGMSILGIIAIHNLKFWQGAIALVVPFLILVLISFAIFGTYTTLNWLPS
ncbi:YIP1 family protein [Bacillus sp. NPDC077027]|uniref:YIP1 family protein n=1 Tax=Bacillus sp. NPDC077027 TaxID=3390548 RepID=UPI003D0295E4